jgi:hypothetical protein
MDPSLRSRSQCAPRRVHGSDSYGGGAIGARGFARSMQ